MNEFVYIKLQWLKSSIRCALENGYIAIANEDAFSGAVYIKNGIKWIHEIELLKLKLEIVNDVDLVGLGYNVGDFYKYNTNNFPKYAKEIVRQELLDIFMEDFLDYPDRKIYLGDGIYMDENGDLLGDWDR